MTKPVMLDLFCCEGGAAAGYAAAGWDVYGVDLEKRMQKRYPFPFHHGNAPTVMETLNAGGSVEFTRKDRATVSLTLADIHAVHGSPPCQGYSITKHSHHNEYPMLVEPVRAAFIESGLPYIIENVVGAPLETPLTLCGSEFGRIVSDTDGRRLFLRRHRLFESNVFLFGAGGCRCIEFKARGWGIGGVYGGGSADRAHAKNVRRGGYTPGRDIRAALIGADWMTLHGLSQSIPPAYTEHLGAQLLAHLDAHVA